MIPNELRNDVKEKSTTTHVRYLFTRTIQTNFPLHKISLLLKVKRSCRIATYHLQAKTNKRIGKPKAGTADKRNKFERTMETYFNGNW